MIKFIIALKDTVVMIVATLLLGLLSIEAKAIFIEISGKEWDKIKSKIT